MFFQFVELSVQFVEVVCYVLVEVVIGFCQFGLYWFFGEYVSVGVVCVGQVEDVDVVEYDVVDFFCEQWVLVFWYYVVVWQWMDDGFVGDECVFDEIVEQIFVIVYVQVYGGFFVDQGVGWDQVEGVLLV